MRPIEDKGCLNNINGLPSQEASTFEFHKNALTRSSSSHHRTALGKPTPSKWDDAQKWLVNLSRGEKNPAKSSPRNSNADDRRFIVPAGPEGPEPFEEETKNVDSLWRINLSGPKSAEVRSVCVRDMGTEMTPIASQEPSRTATPIRAARSPISPGPSTPVRGLDGALAIDNANGEAVGRDEMVVNKNEDYQCSSKPNNPMENRAVAWDEAEQAKYTARYKREEVKIQAWENHQKRKAEIEKRKIEVKAERLKSRAEEKYTNKVAATRRIAEERRANAEAKLNEKAVKTSQRADYIRRTGHLPSTFSFKFPCFCGKCK